MMAAMPTRVVRALRAWGSLNAETPLEIASTPVRAVTPAEKACRMRNSDTGTSAARSWLARLRRRVLDRAEPAERPPPDAPQHHHGHAGHIQVGGDGEDPPGLAQAAQVAPGQQDDEADRDHHPPRLQGVEGRGEGGRAGRDAHGHGQDVVDDQGRPGDRGDQAAEVVPADHIGPARGAVGLDDLPIRQHQDAEQPGDGDRDRQGQPDRGRPGEHQDQEDLLGGIGGGGDRVGGEHGQRDPLGDALVGQLAGSAGPGRAGPVWRGSRATHSAVSVSDATAADGAGPWVERTTVALLVTAGSRAGHAEAWDKAWDSASAYCLGRRKGPVKNRRRPAKKPSKPRHRTCPPGQPYAQGRQRHGRPLVGETRRYGDVTSPTAATPAGREDGDG